jgi:hypothetical protein
MPQSVGWQFIGHMVRTIFAAGSVTVDIIYIRASREGYLVDSISTTLPGPGHFFLLRPDQIATLTHEPMSRGV